jgi:hypothetical protein
MKPREFHIWNFPKNKIRVFFNSKTKEKFFHDCREKFGSLKNYSEFLGITYGSVIGWKIQNLAIPMWIIHKTKNKIGWDWNFIEMNIIAYKGIGHGNSIRNVKLPLKETPQLFEIITHIIGDGCIDRKSGMLMYINKEKTLITNFKNLVNFCFGNSYVYVNKKEGITQLIYPKVLADIIKHLYKIEFHSEISTLPENVFSLPREFSYSVIRSIIDDEGTIRDCAIVIQMKNKYLIDQIRKLLISIVGRQNIPDVKIRNGNMFEISITSKGLKSFKEKIKLIHPMKVNDLAYAIKKQKIRSRVCRYTHGYSKEAILKMIKEHSMTTKELAHKLFIQRSNTSIHLKQLESRNLVTRKESIYSFEWSITKKGINFLYSKE